MTEHTETMKRLDLELAKQGLEACEATVTHAQEVEKIMNRFATYTGSSPYKTPAFMNQLAVVEMVKGAYFPDGGIYSIPTALHKLCVDLWK
mgnify:CR=1 FL=1